MVTPKIEVKNLVVRFGNVDAVKDLSLSIFPNEVLSVIGPSSSGKTTFLRSLNRLNDLEDNFKSGGKIYLDGKDINREIPPETLRKKVGMIFALPIPLPLSIYDNISYGPRMAGLHSKKELNRIVEESLKSAFLWD